MAYPKRIENALSNNASGANMYNASNYIIQTTGGVIYAFYVDDNTDPGYKKSTDWGQTWGSFVQLKACSCTQIAVWADWWSGITATAYIHVCYTDSGADDTYYRTIDTANSDTLGTERTVFAGSSTASGGTLSVCRARGGNVMVAVCIDAGAEYDTRKTVDLGVNWTSPAEVLEGATTDQVILAPGWGADNQDMMAFFMDASADELSVKFYDDSGDSWSETSLSGSISDNNIASFYSVAVDLTNSQNLVATWTAYDTANADLRIWKVTEAAQTELTNVILNSTDDQAFCSIGVDMNSSKWVVMYAGSSDGAETYASALNIYCKTSVDGGSTWGSEEALTTLPLSSLIFFYGTPRFYNFPSFLRSQYDSGSYVNKLSINTPLTIRPRATFQLGM